MRDELFLVGTSEVSLAALHADDILDGRRRCRAATPASPPAFGARRAPPARTPAASSACTSSTRSRCSRSCAPDASTAEHERILAIEERILAALELPYRVVDIPVGDLGAPAARKFDCEAWIPSQEPLPRAHLVLEHHRLPGPPPRRALPPRGGRPARGPAHPERHRRRRRPHPDRPDRERPARGRLGRAAHGAGRSGRPGVDPRLAQAWPPSADLSRSSEQELMQ